MAWSNASVSAEEIEAEEGVDASLCGNSENLFVFLSSPATEHVNLFWAAKYLRRGGDQSGKKDRETRWSL